MPDVERDHDMTVRLEEKLTALDRLIQEQFKDRDRARNASAAETAAQIDRLGERLSAVIEAQGLVMSRNEARLLIDALGTRMDTTQKAVTDIAQSFASMRASLSGQSSGTATAEARQVRNRNLLVGMAAVGATLLGIIVGVVVKLL